jgi:hypothetical protein
MKKTRTTGKTPCKKCGHLKRQHVHVETTTSTVVTRCSLCDCRMFRRKSDG